MAKANSKWYDTPSEDPEYEVYTDGCCLGNPGPGGSSAIILHNSIKRMVRQLPIPAATNNIAEITAVIIGLKALIGCMDKDCASRKTTAHLYTDSQYVCGLLRSNWTAKKNVGLVEEMRELVDSMDIRVCWVRGHTGNKFNEECDTYANAMAASVDKAIAGPSATESGEN